MEEVDLDAKMAEISGAEALSRFQEDEGKLDEYGGVVTKSRPSTAERVRIRDQLAEAQIEARRAAASKLPAERKLHTSDFDTEETRLARREELLQEKTLTLTLTLALTLTLIASCRRKPMRCSKPTG